jgi:glycerophosphoryl diester phosphodiesterase
MPQGDGLFHPTPSRFVDLVVSVLRKQNIASRSVIQSFDVRPLKYLHEMHPQIPAALLVEEHDILSVGQRITKLGFIPSINSPHYSHVTLKLVKECENMGMKIIPWTVNDLKDMRRLKTLGVHGIITDYPNLFTLL